MPIVHIEVLLWLSLSNRIHPTVSNRKAIHPTAITSPQALGMNESRIHQEAISWFLHGKLVYKWFSLSWTVARGWNFTLNFQIFLETFLHFWNKFLNFCQHFHISELNFYISSNHWWHFQKWRTPRLSVRYCKAVWRPVVVWFVLGWFVTTAVSKGLK